MTDAEVNGLGTCVKKEEEGKEDDKKEGKARNSEKLMKEERMRKGL